VSFLSISFLKELDDFTLEFYVHLLESLGNVYTIIPFCQAPARKTPYLILRHDIDYSVSAALRFAKIEHAAGVRATYFALFSDSLYDVNNEENSRMVKQIAQLGHEIGLHYFPHDYYKTHGNPEKTLKTQIRLLEQISGQKVITIARHNAWDRDPFANHKGLINANSPYYRGDLYVHDSCRAWSSIQGLISLFSAAPPKRVQLLIHPDNWQTDKVDRRTLLDRLLRNTLKNSSVLRKEFEKYWIYDPVIVQYDRSIRQIKAGFLIEQVNGVEKINPLTNSAKTYDSLIRWYLINTKIGWNLHKLIGTYRRIIFARSKVN
jgi:hypothetical protein